MKREHPALVLAHSGRSLNSAATWLSETLERHKGAVLAVFSIAYFALTFYRASRKLFWLAMNYLLCICPACLTSSQYGSRLKACCNAEPAIVGRADFLASHDAFLVYGGGRYAYRLEYFVKTGATVKTVKEAGGYFEPAGKYVRNARNILSAFLFPRQS